MVKGGRPSPGVWGCAPTFSSPRRRLRRRVKKEKELFGSPITCPPDRIPRSPGREASRLPAPSAASTKPLDAKGEHSSGCKSVTGKYRGENKDYLDRIASLNKEARFFVLFSREMSIASLEHLGYDRCVFGSLLNREGTNDGK